MRKIALALVLALGLSGCASVQKVLQGAEYVTASYTNPVSREKLYAAENGMIVAVAGLNVYKQSCARGLVGADCKQVVAKIQVYTRKLPPLLKQLRTFVKNNDQVNAIVVYNEFVKIVDQFQAEAKSSGVTL